MRLLMLILIAVLSSSAELIYAAEFKLIDLDSFDMKAAKFGANRDPLTPDIAPDKYVGRVESDFKLRILEVFYWDNQVHTEGVEAKVQTVGWHWELGLRINKQFSIFHEHHSRHRMDDATPIDYDRDGQPDKYPVEDSYGIRMNFYINPTPARSLFK